MTKPLNGLHAPFKSLSRAIPTKNHNLFRNSHNRLAAILPCRLDILFPRVTNRIFHFFVNFLLTSIALVTKLKIF